MNIAPLLASASIFGVALGFGSQKLVQDLITGIFLLMENAMQVGDWVTLAGVSGTVEYLSIRTVRLRGGDGSLYTVPFSSVSTVNNTNRGIGNAAVRVTIALGQDVDLAISTLKEIGAALREDERSRTAFCRTSLLGRRCGGRLDRDARRPDPVPRQRALARAARIQPAHCRRLPERGIEIANPQRHLLTWDAESAPARIEADEGSGPLSNDTATPASPVDDVSPSAPTRQGDAPVEDQIPVDPKPAGGPGTPANPGTPSPHQ